MIHLLQSEREVLSAGEKYEKRSSRCQVKHDMRGVRDETIADWQEVVRVAEHDPITGSAIGFRPEKIGNPPGTDLSNKDEAIADAQPHVKPMRVGSPEVQQAEPQAKSEWHALDQSYNRKAPERVLAAYCGHIVETRERDPIVNPEEKHLKCLQYEQSDLDTRIRWEDLRHFRGG